MEEFYIGRIQSRDANVSAVSGFRVSADGPMGAQYPRELWTPIPDPKDLHVTVHIRLLYKGKGRANRVTVF